MKLNIAHPFNGTQKTFECVDDRKLAILNEKRISQEIEGEALDPDWAGYTFRIAGGNDKQGFPLLQGVLTNNRVKLLMKKGSKCFRERRKGERRKKSVRGCILDINQLSVVNLVITKEGEKPIEALSEKKPKKLGPKRASKIRKLFNLDKTADIRQYVIRRKIEKNGKVYYKSPKIQRLITPERLQRKRRLLKIKAKRQERSSLAKAEYEKFLQQRKNEKIINNPHKKVHAEQTSESTVKA